MAIGQAGSIVTNSPGENDLIRVNLDEPLTDPVFALTATNTGGNPFVLRVVATQTDANGDVVSFDFIIEEWEYLDGPHPATETINWLAIETGVHQLPDGRVIEAGTVATNPGSGDTGVTLNGGFSDPPVVLTSVMSNNDTTTVDSDPLNITASGFNIQMQEEEDEDDDHASETVGYIAIQSGGSASAGTANTFGGLDENIDTFSLGDTFNDAVVLGETQTINGQNPGNVMLGSGGTNATTQMYLQEEESDDTEIKHTNETVGVVAFEDGLIMCFTPDAQIRTAGGYRNILDLHAGDTIITLDNGPKSLHWMAHSHLDCARLNRDPGLAPIRISAGALGAGQPRAALTVSPQHRVLITGWRAELLFGSSEVLVPAKALINGTTITQMPSDRPAHYIHLLFEQHEIIDSSGLWTESLYPAQLDAAYMETAARQELHRIFPDLHHLTHAYGPLARHALTVREARLLAA